MLYKEIKSSAFRKILNTLFSIMLVELVIGGGGRFFEFGPLTLRMILYFTAITISLIYILLKRKIESKFFYLTFTFIILIIISTIIGIINGASLTNIFEDIKPLSFFLILPFIAICIRNRINVDKTIKIIKYSSLLMGITYIVLILLIFTRVLPFMKFYTYIMQFGEVSFRNRNLFFFKGFLYLCVGFFFFLVSPGKLNKLFACILLISIFLTLTRGFILSTLAVTLFYLLFIIRNKLKSLLAFITALIIIIISIPFYVDSIGDKSESDAIRYLQINQVIQKTNSCNFLVGDGLGIGVPIRPTHMEISYLEIFSKQGVIGLLFWLSIFIYISFLYFKLYNKGKMFTLYSPLFLSVIFIYLQSGTNPYLNNPIGLSMILISLVCLIRVNETCNHKEDLN